MNHAKTAANIATVLIVAMMVGMSELLREPEIIFPEITALAIGALAAPRLVWKTSRLRMVLLIAVSAIGGVFLVKWVPLPLWGKMVLAFFLCQILYAYSGTTFAPLISAMVLPVLLGTTSWVYPVAAVVLTLLIIAIRRLFERAGVREWEPFVPAPRPSRQDLLYGAGRVACMAVFTGIALAIDARFCIAPPLLVAFTEFTGPECAARRMPVRVVSFISLCAAGGALCRWGLTMQLGLPLTVSAVAAAGILLLLVPIFGLYIPPAGAMAILPMLIPVEAVLFYPIQVLAGSAVWMLLACLLFPIRCIGARHRQPE